MQITKPHRYLAIFGVALLAACMALAQQPQGGVAQPGQPGQGRGRGAGGGGQGRGQAPASPSAMTFFVTSVGMGKGGDLGGLAGADAHCQVLATAAGAGNHTWRAYLSTQARPGQPAINARDRIGTGPWRNYSFAELGQPQNFVVSQNLAELHGDTLVQAQRGSNFFKQSARNEKNEVIHGIGDMPPIEHEILTGSQTDGRAFTDTADHTCNNWTSSGPGSAQVGHSDRIGNANHSWNSSNATTGCSQAAFENTGGAGLFYCFAIN
jgi:hypothetical protein